VSSQIARQIVWERLAAQRVAQPAEEAEDVDGSLDSPVLSASGLAFFAGQQLGQLRLPRFEDLRRLTSARGLGPPASSPPRLARLPSPPRRLRQRFLATERVFGYELAAVRRIEVCQR